MLEMNLDKSVILYIGDSASDEPAFEWVNNHQGISVRVGKDAKSIAQFEINTPKEVEEF